jgi:hypothetical protein
MAIRCAFRPLRLGVRKVRLGMNENEISKILVESAVEVHRELGGPGLLKAVSTSGEVFWKEI